MGRVFANDLEDGSLILPKTQEMVLDTSLVKTQHYKVWIKSKWSKSRGKSSGLPYTLKKKLSG